MSRDLPEDLLETFKSGEVFPFFALELYFDDDRTLRLWTGRGNLVVEGLEYIGTGSMLSVSEVEETAEIAASGATINLSGVAPEVVSLALSEPYQGRTCKIFFGSIVSEGIGHSLLKEDSDYILLEDGAKISLGRFSIYTEIFSGYMDTMDIVDNGDSSLIELKATNKLVDLERPRVARYTSAYQKFLYPNDKGLDFVESIQDKIVYWGRST